MVIALRIYYASRSTIEIPAREETKLDIELLISRKWILYTLALIFGISLLSTFLSIDHLADTYKLTELDVAAPEIPVQEIIPVDQVVEQASAQPEITEQANSEANSIEEPVNHF